MSVIEFNQQNQALNNPQKGKIEFKEMLTLEQFDWPDKKQRSFEFQQDLTTEGSSTLESALTTPPNCMDQELELKSLHNLHNEVDNGKISTKVNFKNSQKKMDFAKPKIDCEKVYPLKSLGKFSTFPLTFNFLYKKGKRLEKEHKKKKRAEKLKRKKLAEKRKKREERELRALKAQGVRTPLRKKIRRRRRESRMSRAGMQELKTKQKIIKPIADIGFKVLDTLKSSKEINMSAAEQLCQLMYKHKLALQEQADLLSY